MKENKEREKFEAWISVPPFGMDVERYPDDPGRFSWPRNYRRYEVELAWQGWLAGSGRGLNGDGVDGGKK